ncbi:MAG: FkbM family methyltransferase [Candidatus Thermoplasmatota archaeon]|nr:FkbM family methyltransferase [Candidatus Thermoplasmatota archaeon]
MAQNNKIQNNNGAAIVKRPLSFEKSSDYSERIMSPTYPGFARRMLYFKLNELSYFRRNNGSTLSFFLNQFQGDKRASLNEAWEKRGIIRASSLKIGIPESLPPQAINEVIGDRIYEIDGFVPGSASTVIDIGAQFGDFSVICSKVHGVKEIHAFEPVKENITILKEFFLLNQVENAKVYEVALSDQVGDRELSFEGNQLQLGNSGRIKQLVEFRRLDDFKLKCDLLKIDVEGFEIQVLKGGMQTIMENMPRIIMEVHSSKLKKATMSILNSIGYRIVHHDRWSFLNGNIQNVFLEPNH